VDGGGSEGGGFLGMRGVPLAERADYFQRLATWAFMKASESVAS
jgi:hypothetical protein